LCFYETYIYYYYYYKILLAFCSGSPSPQMSITFDNEADIML